MVRASASTVQEWVAICAFDSSDAQHFAVPLTIKRSNGNSRLSPYGDADDGCVPL